jgi:uncharacterized protein (DUF427 family)
VVLRIVLGALYVGMAAGQLASWPAMPGILNAYDAAPAGVLPWLAAVLIAAELLAGAWLLLRPRSRAMTPVWVYTAVALIWAVLGAQASARGLAVHNCGCFGRYLGQRLSWFTLAQDGLLLVYAAIMVRGGLRARRSRIGAGDRGTDEGDDASMTMRAVWNGAVLAESDDTVVVEGNRYFPPQSLNRQYFTGSSTHTVCPWKGIASYHTIIVDGAANPDAAWFYPDPNPAAGQIRDRIAFWHGVQVEAVPHATDGQQRR